MTKRDLIQEKQMALNSMTGHGRGESSFKGTRVVVELSSVNHRQFDLRLELPPCLAGMETEIRQILHSAIARGSVLCRFHVVPGARISAHQVFIDYGLTRQCLQAAGRMAGKRVMADDFGISALFSIPGVIKIIPAHGQDAEIKRPALGACRSALEKMCAMRATEGLVLGRDIRRRIRRLKLILAKIAHRRPAVVRQYKSRLKTMLCSAAGEGGNKKLLREIIMVAERGDISEELERSRSHIAQFGQLLAKNEPVGRTMDFLVQEMMREINTTGAKSNDCFISNLVVNYKSELESIREQIQNIE